MRILFILALVISATANAQTENQDAESNKIISTVAANVTVDEFTNTKSISTDYFKIMKSS